MNITRKLKKFRKLISEGSYMAITRQILLNLFGKKSADNATYYMLYRKYRSFTLAQKSVELPLLVWG